jgi:hypothetical protein
MARANCGDGRARDRRARRLIEVVNASEPTLCAEG